MKQDLFVQRLKELAEVKRIRPPKGPQTREADSAQDIWRNGETMIIDKDNNSTWAYEVKKLKPIVKPCEDCGVEVQDRRVTNGLYVFPKKHWRKTCNGCNRVQDPETGKFDILPMKAQYHFLTLFKKQG